MTGNSSQVKKYQLALDAHYGRRILSLNHELFEIMRQPSSILDHFPDAIAQNPELYRLYNGLLYVPSRVFSPDIDEGAAKVYSDFFNREDIYRVVSLTSNITIDALLEALQKEYGIDYNYWVMGVIAPFMVRVEKVGKLLEDLAKNPLKYLAVEA